MQPAVTVHVSDHTLGLLDGDELPVETGSWSNGLVRTMTAGALIYTGIDRGFVTVLVGILGSPPAGGDLAAWDEVVDVSVASPHGSLRVSSLEQGPVATLPVLSSAGQGTYRLRVHASGRDEHFDQVQNDASENYLILVWPTEHLEPDLVLRATDRCGENLRLAQARSAGAPPPPAIAAELAEEQRRRAVQHQALLDAARTDTNQS